MHLRSFAWLGLGIPPALQLRFKFVFRVQNWYIYTTARYSCRFSFCTGHDVQYFWFYKQERECVCVGRVQGGHWCVSVLLSVLIICFFISALVGACCCYLSVASLVTMALVSVNLCRWWCSSLSADLSVHIWIRTSASQCTRKDAVVNLSMTAQALGCRT